MTRNSLAHFLTFIQRTRSQFTANINVRRLFFNHCYSSGCTCADYKKRTAQNNSNQTTSFRSQFSQAMTFEGLPKQTARNETRQTAHPPNCLRWIFYLSWTHLFLTFYSICLAWNFERGLWSPLKVAGSLDALSISMNEFVINRKSSENEANGFRCCRCRVLLYHCFALWHFAVFRIIFMTQSNRYITPNRYVYLDLRSFQLNWIQFKWNFICTFACFYSIGFVFDFMEHRHKNLKKTREIPHSRQWARQPQN